MLTIQQINKLACVARMLLKEKSVPGITFLGNGHFSSVYDVSDLIGRPNTVLKMCGPSSFGYRGRSAITDVMLSGTCSQKDGWPDWAEHCIRNKVPNSPTVYHIERKQNWCWAVMERTYSAYGVGPTMLRSAVETLANNWAYVRRYGLGFAGMRNRMRTAQSYYGPHVVSPEWRRTARAIGKVIATYAYYSTDMHEDNWRVSVDGKLIVSDPIA